MLALYCQMKKKKKRSEDAYNDFYKNIVDTKHYVSKHKLPNKCRVCLQEGILVINEIENSNEIVDAIEMLGKIKVTETENYPERLCAVCYKFITAAISFRKAVAHTEEILQRSVTEEINEYDNYSEDHHNDSDSSVNKDSMNWEEQGTKTPMKKKDKEQLSRKVTCHICNKVMNRSYFKEHVTVHDPNHTKEFVCDICGKSFRLRCSYYNHIARHNQEFTYKCQYCPYRAKYVDLLKMHLRTHTGDYRYMCTECPARFLYKSNLNVHMLKHKEPHLKCDSCKRAFHTKLRLQRHYEADHLGIKNHVCNICGKEFGYRNAMMKHQRLVHKREKLQFRRLPSYLQADQS